MRKLKLSPGRTISFPPTVRATSVERVYISLRSRIKKIDAVCYRDTRSVVTADRNDGLKSQFIIRFLVRQKHLATM